MAHDNRYLVGVAAKTGQQAGLGQEVVLLVDEGVHYFELRAIYIRGHAQPADAPKGASASQVWFELVPIKTVAWDYGSMREVGDAS